MHIHENVALNGGNYTLYSIRRLRLCWYYCYWPKDGQLHVSRSQNLDGFYWCPFGYRIALSMWSYTYGIEWVSIEMLIKVILLFTRWTDNWHFFSDRSRCDIRYWRVSNMARMVSAGIEIFDNAMVLMGTAKHNEIWAFNEKIRFFTAFWCIESGVVHLFAGRCNCCVASQRSMAL